VALLGDILASARRDAGNFHAWLSSADPELARSVDAAAAAEGLTPSSYVRAAIADFSRFAGEEDWATLSSTLKRTEDPGTTCLTAMVDWRLTVKACDHHSHGAHEGETVDDRA
jgi:hypothetical protein